MDLSKLVDVLDGLPKAEHAGDGFRHVAVGRAPLSGEGARLFGGRWNPRHSFATLYLAGDVDTAIREFLRMAHKQGLAPDGFLPRNLVVYEVRLQNVVDLRVGEHQEALGLVGSWLESDDNSSCQMIGEAAHHAGSEAILAPSATGAGEVLAVFLD